MNFKSRLNVHSSEFKANQNHHLQLIKDLQAQLNLVALGGGKVKSEKHRSKGKLLVRERIAFLIDPQTHFLELSALAACKNYDGKVASAGVVTGIALVNNKQVMIVANDATVKGGTYFPETVKKHLRAQQIAMENNLPCVYLVDSGGAFLPMQAQVFPDREHFGRIFFNQAQMSAKGIPQIACVMGSCTAGGAYVPAMSDQSIIVKEQGTIFLGGPPLVKAATGEVVSSEELGGAHVHTHISGVADYYAEDDEDALLQLRRIIADLPQNNLNTVDYNLDKNFGNRDDILGVLPKSLNESYDIRDLMKYLLDEGEFDEFKEHYGKTIICAFARIHGQQVGVIANNGILFSESSLKATHFIELCCQRQIPLIFLQNITGFMVGKKYEHEGIAKHGAKLVMAVSNAQVPKITIVVGGSYGAGNYGMSGRAYDPRFLFMWPNAKISVMGGEQAANVLWSVKSKQDKSEEKKFKDSILNKYNEEGSAYYSTSNLWDDGIIDPRDTRDILAMCLQVCKQADAVKTKYGVFRM